MDAIDPEITDGCVTKTKSASPQGLALLQYAFIDESKVSTVEPLSLDLFNINDRIRTRQQSDKLQSDCFLHPYIPVIAACRYLLQMDSEYGTCSQ